MAAVPKPLVWGPVGGGVEPPLSLMTELGLRGALDDLSRVTSRRLLARLPPMRLAPDTAVVVLAQNREIARRLRASAPIHVLPNATAVELDGIRARANALATWCWSAGCSLGKVAIWRSARCATSATPIRCCACSAKAPTSDRLRAHRPPLGALRSRTVPGLGPP